MNDWIRKDSGKISCWWESVEPEGPPYYIAFDDQLLHRVEEHWILDDNIAPFIAPDDLPIGACFEVWDEWIAVDLREISSEDCFTLARVSEDAISLQFSIYRSENDYHDEPGEFEREVQSFYEVAKEASDAGAIDAPRYDAESWDETFRKMNAPFISDEPSSEERNATEVADKSTEEPESQESDSHPTDPSKLPTYNPYAIDPFAVWDPPDSPSWYSCTFGRTFNIEEQSYESLKPILDEGIRIRDEVFTEVDRRLGRLDEPEEVNDEEAFTRRVVTPLLRDLGFRHVEITHGPNENGKDIVFARLTEFGDYEWWTAQVKFGSVSGSAKKGTVQTILNQIRSAFGTQFVSAYTKRHETISKVAVIVSDSFTSNAKDEMIQRLNDPARRSNIMFIDGARIEELRRVVERKKAQRDRSN